MEATALAGPPTRFSIVWRVVAVISTRAAFRLVQRLGQLSNANRWSRKQKATP